MATLTAMTVVYKGFFAAVVSCVSNLGTDSLMQDRSARYLLVRVRWNYCRLPEYLRPARPARSPRGTATMADSAKRRSKTPASASGAAAMVGYPAPCKKRDGEERDHGGSCFRNDLGSPGLGCFSTFNNLQTALPTYAPA